jgi:hypothetical protein
MNTSIAWGLAAAAIAAGYWGWGWPGVVLGVTVVVFWLLLQFSRSLRVLKNAGSAPVGRIDSAVMLHSQLQSGMRLMQVVQLTRSLGRKVGDAPERWAWADTGGAMVTLAFEQGRLVSWDLARAAESSVGDGPPT